MLYLCLVTGITTGLAPMYLTEISPIRVRGVYGLLNQLGITAFIFISQLLGLPKVCSSLMRYNRNSLLY